MTTKILQVTPWYEVDMVVMLVPKFKIKDGIMEEFASLMPKFVKIMKANDEGACINYGFINPLLHFSSSRSHSLYAPSLLCALITCIHHGSSKTPFVWHSPSLHRPSSLDDVALSPNNPYHRSDWTRMVSSFVVSADTIMRHLDNIGDVLNEALQVREEKTWVFPCMIFSLAVDHWRDDEDGCLLDVGFVHLMCHTMLSSSSPSFLFCQYADIVNLMMQCPKSKLKKLKAPLADFSPSYYPLIAGSLRSRNIR